MYNVYYFVVHVDYSGGVKVTVTVQVGSSGNKAQVICYIVEYMYCKFDTLQDHVLLGVIRVSPECNWPTMDQKIYAILEVFVTIMFWLVQFVVILIGLVGIYNSEHGLEFFKFFFYTTSSLVWLCLT